MFTFHIAPFISFISSIVLTVIILIVSKRALKKLFSVVEVDESWYKGLDIIYSILKVLLVAGAIIFAATRIFFHDVTVKSYNTRTPTQIEQYNQKQLEGHESQDPNSIEQHDKEMNELREQELNDKIREKNQKARDEFQKYLDTL